VATALRGIGASLVGTGSPYAVTPGSVVKADGRHYSVFTPFSRAWRAHGWDRPLAAPGVDWRGAPHVAGDGPPVVGDCDVPIELAGEEAADARWSDVLPRLATYADTRDRPDLDGTSRLSAALRWGVLHPRQLLTALGPDGGHRAFASELAWREFYADVLQREPRSAWHNIDGRMDSMTVDTDASARSRFGRWAAGDTGFPIVDAGMRQLRRTGWMHNRVRMVTASFLVKDLHLPWQWGARHFLAHLVDGDLASNNLSWQWVAGTGTDAAPYFRVFNPTAQAARFDPDGEYVRTWAGPGGYPPPMLDHAAEREDALRRYRRSAAGSR
jgi:deoxyribodipyrimidine photo-lyase